MKRYSIKNWDGYYEKAQTRKVERAQWVPLPVKHDGLGFRRLMAMPDGLKIFGAWVLIVQIAAKCTPRGSLADEKGPLTPEDLAIKTGASEEDFTRALEVLISERIGWMVVSEVGPKNAETVPSHPSGSPDTIPDTTQLPLHDKQDRTIQNKQTHTGAREPLNGTSSELAAVPDDPLVLSIARTCRQNIDRCGERMILRISRCAESLCELEPELSRQEIAILVDDFGPWHSERNLREPIPAPEWIVDKWGPFKDWKQNGNSKRNGTVQVGANGNGSAPPAWREHYRRELTVMKTHLDPDDQRQPLLDRALAAIGRGDWEAFKNEREELRDAELQVA